MAGRPDGDEPGKRFVRVFVLSISRSRGVGIFFVDDGHALVSSRFPSHAKTRFTSFHIDNADREGSFKPSIWEQYLL